MSNELLQDLTGASAQNLSHTGGVISLPEQSIKLYFNRGTIIGFVDLSGPTPEQMKALANACEPTPPEKSHKNVDDNRKEGRLDATDFALNFDLSATGIIRQIVKELFANESSVRSELHELNLYGSLSKPRKVAPSGESLFGTLVLVLPVPHEGGQLILRPDGLPEAHYDMHSEKEYGKPVILYAAFCKDTEYQVLPVTSGYRVSLTYHLFFDDAKWEITSPSTPLTSPLDHPFAISLVRALRSPEFLPKGGTLGYTLQSEYHIVDDSLDLSAITDNLKGKDASIAKLFSLLGLEAKTKVVYLVWQSDDERMFAHDYIPFINGGVLHFASTIVEALRESGGVELSWGDDDSGEEEDADENDEVTSVVWITKPDFKGHRISYFSHTHHHKTLDGNDGSFVFLIPVGSYPERTKGLVPILQKFSSI
ncbi:hypothetical protein ONZ45_g16231 [Pleurotus djamor]|nr:hypothetical protein ONZ45_g16231 [Pleurotus djamor]